MPWAISRVRPCARQLAAPASVFLLCTALLSSTAQAIDRRVTTTSQAHDSAALGSAAGPQSPLTAGAFWSRVISVLAEQHGEINQSSVEGVFGVSLTNEGSDRDTLFYSTVEGTSYVDVSLVVPGFEFGAHASTALSLDWAHTAFSDRGEGQCVDTALARRTLGEIGWSQRSKERAAAYDFDIFVRNSGRDRVYVTQVGSCVVNVSIALARE